MEVQGQASVEKCVVYRVQVSSKQRLTEQMDRYKDLLKKVLDGQTTMDQPTRTRLLEHMLEKFSTVVQDNVLVNGQPWDDAPDDEVEDEALTLDTQLDDIILETVRKRRRYPKEIRPHLVSSLQAERKLMRLYEQTVKPEKMEIGPEQENIMNSVSSSATVKEVAQVIKAMKTLQQRAEGLCEVLNTRPSSTDQEIYKDVFGGDGGLSGALLPHAIAVKRAVAMAETEEGYTELSK